MERDLGNEDGSLMQKYHELHKATDKELLQKFCRATTDMSLSQNTLTRSLTMQAKFQSIAMT